MKTYMAFFYTKADWAKTTIKAPTPELALQRARESEETDFLDFHDYDSGTGVEHIEILIVRRQGCRMARSGFGSASRRFGFADGAERPDQGGASCNRQLVARRSCGRGTGS
jgi:hypothetical protein